MIINNRADLELLRGTPEWPLALRMLAGATVQWRNTAQDEATPVWQQAEDLSSLARLGITKNELIVELAVAGIVLDPPQTPPVVEVTPRPPMFLARDLLDLLTDDDLVKIETATAANVSLRRLWVRLLGRGDAAIEATSASFLAGWTGLTQALGQERADEIAMELGIPAAR